MSRPNYGAQLVAMAGLDIARVSFAAQIRQLHLQHEPMKESSAREALRSAAVFLKLCEDRWDRLMRLDETARTAMFADLERKAFVYLPEILATDRQYKEILKPHWEHLEPKMKYGLRTKAGKLSPEDSEDALNEAMRLCLEYAGVARRPSWTKDENAYLQRANQTPKQWFAHVLGYYARNEERRRRRAAMRADLDAPVNPDDAESESLIDTIEGSDDVARNAALILLRQQGEKLIVELVDDAHAPAVFLLALDGYSQDAIAHKVGISQPTVSRSLARTKEVAAENPELSEVLSDIAQAIGDSKSHESSITVTNRACDLANWTEGDLSKWVKRAKSNPEEYERRQALAESAREERKRSAESVRLDRRAMIANSKIDKRIRFAPRSQPIEDDNDVLLRVHNAYKPTMRDGDDGTSQNVHVAWFRGIRKLPDGQKLDESDAVLARKLEIARRPERTRVTGGRE